MYKESQHNIFLFHQYICFYHFKGFSFVHIAQYYQRTLDYAYIFIDMRGFLKLISSYDTKARFIPPVFISICPLQQVLKSIVESAFLF